MTEATGARVDVETAVGKDPEAMWDLVTDIGRIGEWSPECVGASWLDGGMPLAGARFVGRNRSSSGFEWTTTCVVTQAERPSVFEWVVLDSTRDPQRPGATWRYELVPGSAGQTIVRHSFVHGPGATGVTEGMESDPDQAEALLQGRLDELREHMTTTIAGMAGALPVVSDANQDDESRMLLGFLQYQRDSVLKIVEGLPEEAWQTPVVPSGWTVAGMLWHLGGVEHHWLQHVTTGVMEEQQTGEEQGDEEEGAYDPEAAFVCDEASADLIANYRDECRRSDEVLATTPLDAAPRGLGFHPDPEYTKQITNVRWIVLHVIEETAAHSGHLEIARELLDGKTRLGGR
jgi:uncharacterized damage-inducible protein DinB